MAALGPRSLPPLAFLAVVALAAALPFLFSGEYRLFLGTQTGIYLLVAMGLNLLAGYGGQTSIGHGALVAVGAYTTAIATVDYGLSFWLAAVIAGVATTAAGLLMAVPAFRLSAWYFALITLGFAHVVQSLLVELGWLTHGYAGIIGVPMPAIGGQDLSARQFYWLVGALDVACFLALRNLVRSRVGYALVAVRDNAAAAQASGASVIRLKLLAFAVSALIAGIAGALFAAQVTVITPDDFPTDFSVFFLLVIVLGGEGTLAGPFVGVLVFFLVPELLTALQSWRLLVYGVVLLVLMLFAPQGLVGMLDGWIRHWRTSRLPVRPGADVPPPEPVTGLRLQADGIVKAFGGVHALNGVSLHVEPGSVHAIVGPNGSGKTTLLNVISGFYVADGGTVRADATPIDRHKPHLRARLGIGRTFQTPKLLPGLTVVENVVLGSFAEGRSGALACALATPRARREATLRRGQAARFLEFVGLSAKAGDSAAELPHGQQRLVEIARALAGRPRLLLLDEPAAGLSLNELGALAALIAAIRRLGTTVVIVEHHLDLVADICDSVSVLDRGTVLASGTPQAVFANQAVVAAYIGNRTAGAKLAEADAG